MPEAPDGRTRAAGVLAGSYASASAIGIRRFRLDAERREFRPVAGRSGVPFPAYLTRSAVSGTYFAVSETTACAAAGPGTDAAQTGLPGTVSNRGPVNTIATFDTTLPDRPGLIGETASGGTWPRHFAVAPDGRFLVVANEHSGRLTSLAVDPDGVAGAPLASAAMPGVSHVEVEAA